MAPEKDATAVSAEDVARLASFLGIDEAEAAAMLADGPIDPYRNPETYARIHKTDLATARLHIAIALGKLRGDIVEE